METIFLTGATGHVGFRVLVLALQATYSVRAAVRNLTKSNGILASQPIKALNPGLHLGFVEVPDLTAEGAFDKVTISTAFTAVHAAGDKLRALAPNSGAYQNEADVFETDPVGAYWGKENYNKLSAIKHAIDPDNILTCWDCIGSVRTDDRYQCYPDIAVPTNKNNA